MKRTLILVKHSEPVLVPGVAPNRWVLSERGRFGSVLLSERLARKDLRPPLPFLVSVGTAETLGVIFERLPTHEEDEPLRGLQHCSSWER